jgi:plasmid stability protein
MATLTIRKVDPEVQKRLRVRAAENGRSMEAELRQILKDAVGGATAAERQEEESGLSLAEAIRRRYRVTTDSIDSTSFQSGSDS